jgi:glutamyl-tRNA reductase
MTFIAFGINHETAPVRIREQIALSEGRMRDVIRRVQVATSAEFILISTCNRTEIYLYGDESAVALFTAAIQDVTGHEWPAQHAFLVREEEAIRHVLMVVTGLKSLVLGDGQIFMQMKDAYRVAVEEDSVGTVMHRFMHTAFRAAKRVSHETSLAEGNASVASAAVAAARAHLIRKDGRGLEGRRVVVLGAGQMGRIAAETLCAGGVEATIINRTDSRALALAETVRARALSWDARRDAIASCDVLFVTTGASEPVIAAADLMPRSTPLVVIDIAVPRNVADDVESIAGCDVIGLDNLNAALVAAEHRRRAAVPAASAIVDEQLVEYVAWVFHHESMQPAIMAVLGTFEDIRRSEIARHAHRFSDLDRAQLDRLTRSIMQKLLAVPVVRLKSTDPGSLDFRRGIELLQQLFARPGCEDGAPGHHYGVEAELLRELYPMDLVREVIRTSAEAELDDAPHVAR